VIKDLYSYFYVAAEYILRGSLMSKISFFSGGHKVKICVRFAAFFELIVF